MAHVIVAGHLVVDPVERNIETAATQRKFE